MLLQAIPSRAALSRVPPGGVHRFHQKSTCLTQLTLGPYVVQIWSRSTPEYEVNENFALHRVGAMTLQDLASSGWSLFKVLPVPNIACPECFLKPNPLCRRAAGGPSCGLVSRPSLAVLFQAIPLRDALS